MSRSFTEMKILCVQYMTLSKDFYKGDPNTMRVLPPNKLDEICKNLVHNKRRLRKAELKDEEVKKAKNK